MTREEAIEYNKNLREYMRITDKKSEYKFLKENYEALEMAIQALEQNPTTKNDLGVDWESYKDVDGNSLDDLILEVLQNNFDCGNTYGYKVADEIIGLLPSVTPQEPILDKIRTEIMQLDCDTDYVDYDYNDMAQTEEVHMICREEVLQIIDKYKAESEDKE